MTSFTIDDFWVKRLKRNKQVSSIPLVEGWAFQDEPIKAFVEAPLTSTPLQNDEVSPWLTSLLMVSAPGAVGKSTLARQIAYVTGAAYVDLATASPVGGHAITGGLAQSNLLTEWHDSQVTLLIDGLDEARLRDTQEAFEAFLADIAHLARGRTVPVVLFGRTAAIQDAWIFLSGGPSPPAIMEIGFYEPTDAVKFVEARLRLGRSDTSFQQVEIEAISALLRRLRNQTEADGNRFSGYAPVLQAVADRVLLEKNAAVLLAEIQSNESPMALTDVVGVILERDRLKLKNLAFSQPDLLDQLYTADEQLGHCVSKVYSVPPPDLPAMSASDSRIYSQALENWVTDHPFLNGSNKPSSAVFDAVITAHALKDPAARKNATERELARGVAANPFLLEFYNAAVSDEKQFLPPDHIGIVYASVRARLTLEETASLSISGDESLDEDDPAALEAEVEIVVTKSLREAPTTYSFKTNQVDTIRLPGYIDDVEISTPYAHVQVGIGTDAVLVAPIDIMCRELATPARTVIIERSQSDDQAVVYLEASRFNGPQIVSVPILRGGVTLKVAWPGDTAFPWTSFATSPT